MNKKPDHIVVGKFGRPRGVSGEIFINSLTDNPERFGKPGTFLIENENGWTDIVVKQISAIGNRLAVKIEGINNLDEAKTLTNKLIYITGSELVEAPEGSYYLFDLIGCELVDTGNKQLGTIVDIEQYPASDVWVVENKGDEFMFPAVKQFVIEVDIKNKKIIVDPPEGIFDSADED
ncbi:MAG: ribosome maturation factor RimM [Candidatus Zixiibacteriota bacterium]